MSKLVRDLIPKQIRDSGKECTVMTAPPLEFIKRLVDKLVEEAQEVRDSLSSVDEAQMLEEIADVSEVFDTLLIQLAIDRNQLRTAKARKNKKAGSFSKRYILVDILEAE